MGLGGAVDRLLAHAALPPGHPPNHAMFNHLPAGGRSTGKVVGRAYLDLSSWTTLCPKLAPSSRNITGSSTSKLNPW